MGLSCGDLLTENFSSIGVNCESIPIIEENLENLASAICDLRCNSESVAVTSDCGLDPSDFFPDLFPSCIEIPNGATVIQICPCNSGGIKLWVYDEDDLGWKRFAKEVAVGNTGDFADPNSPTAAELNALFGGYVANEALVIVRPTKEIWFTESCGVSWTLLDDVPAIGMDVDNTTWNQSFFQDGSTGSYVLIFDETIYSTGSSTTFPIAEDDLINITVVYGYTIETTSGANPVDDVNFRFRISGPVTQFDTDYGTLASGGQLIRNGLMYSEFTIKIRASQVGNLRLRVYETAGGSSVAEDWQWTFFVLRTSVSVERA